MILHDFINICSQLLALSSFNLKQPRPNRNKQIAKNRDQPLPYVDPVNHFPANGKNVDCLDLGVVENPNF